MNIHLPRSETPGIVTAAMSLFASSVAGMTCLVPTLAMAAGIGGLGWLGTFSYLAVPAASVAILLLAVAMVLYTRRRASCPNRRRHNQNRAFLATTALVVIAIGGYELLLAPGIA